MKREQQAAKGSLFTMFDRVTESSLDRMRCVTGPNKGRKDGSSLEDPDFSFVILCSAGFNASIKGFFWLSNLT